MNKKSIMFCAASFASVLLVASDTPEVSDVIMTQQSLGREVTITYKLNNAPNGAVVTLDVVTNATGDVWASIGGEAVCNAQGAVWRKVTSADADGEGRYTIKWRPDLSWEGHKVELADGGARAVVTAWATNNTPDYMVVDISASAATNSQAYYPSADFLPGGLLANDNYRKGLIVMRKIMAKDVKWMMGSTGQETKRATAKEEAHQVVLPNNYYIGVFEITQTQWSLIQSALPSQFANPDDRALRPVEYVCYNEIRNNSSSTTSANTAYDWPSDPHPSSFLGMLRKKTGLDFDLPSESQWEFAARAGNGDTLWGDGSGILNEDVDSHLESLGRYRCNGGYLFDGTSYTAPETSCGAANGTAKAGSYKPNDWGLYDMNGNVWEWCLDWWEDNIATAKDPSGVVYGGRVNINPENSQQCLSGNAPTSSYRMIRGGAYDQVAGACRPANRYISRPTTRSQTIGLRVVCGAGLQ